MENSGTTPIDVHILSVGHVMESLTGHSKYLVKDMSANALQSVLEASNIALGVCGDAELESAFEVMPVRFI